MRRAEQLITENLALWSSAVKGKSSAGRGSSKKLELYGIQKLRNLIIQLAVDGKLVTQHSNDTAACELIREIALEKEKRFKTRKTNKLASIKSDTDLHASATLPNHWEYTRLGNLINLISGQHLKPTEFLGKKDSGAIPYLTGPAEFGELYPEPSRYTHKRMSVAQKGDILITCKGSGVGKTNLANQEIFISRQLMAIEPILISSKFLLLLVESLNDYFRSNIVGIAIPGISRSDVLDAVVALPPLAEQHRIVAKVDELMALCDQLEEEQDNNLETHETLVDTLLNALTSAAADASEFAGAWQRIEDNFDILFTTENSVDQLEKTILQLAVMGKLVEQDVEKEQVLDLVVNKIRAPSPETTTPFELPPSWLWSHLNQLAVINGGFAFKSGNYNNNGTRVVRISDFDEYGFKSGKIVRHEFSAELEKFRLVEGDILMAMTGGTVGKSFHVKSLDEPMIVNQRVATIRASKAITSHFLHIVIQSKGVQEEINKAKNSTNDNISMKQINSFLVPLPPLAEQHRIVNKVDKLMELCVQLKASLVSAQETQLNLADSIMEQAIHSPA